MTSTFPIFWSKLLIDCRIYYAMVTRIHYVYCNVDLMLVYYLFISTTTTLYIIYKKLIIVKKKIKKKLSNIEQQMTNQTHLLSERIHH
jgi:hypothetical protein